jgi:hypothetical protein
MYIWVRLSEKRNLVVGVLEAGIFHQDDALIDVPGLMALKRSFGHLITPHSEQWACDWKCYL